MSCTARRGFAPAQPSTVNITFSNEICPFQAAAYWREGDDPSSALARRVEHISKEWEIALE